MRKPTIILFLCLLILHGWSQAVLENVYPSGIIYAPTKLTNYGWVYPRETSGSPKNIEVYSINHALIKTISMPVPSGHTFSTFWGISDNLFNSDDKIEVLFSYSTSYPANSNTVLYNEEGELKQFFGGQFTGRIYNLDGSYKLITEGSYSDSTISIFSLPGTMVNSYDINIQHDLFSVYPNPCQDHLFVDLNSYPADFIMTDSKGSIIREQKIISSGTIISTNGLTPGNYFYKIKHISGTESTGKIIIKRSY